MCDAVKVTIKPHKQVGKLLQTSTPLTIRDLHNVANNNGKNSTPAASVITAYATKEGIYSLPASFVQTSEGPPSKRQAPLFFAPPSIGMIKGSISSALASWFVNSRAGQFLKCGLQSRDQRGAALTACSYDATASQHDSRRQCGLGGLLEIQDVG